jgi:hypothetical protein
MQNPDFGVRNDQKENVESKRSTPNSESVREQALSAQLSTISYGLSTFRRQNGFDSAHHRFDRFT